MPQATLSGELIGQSVSELGVDEFEFDWYGSSREEKIGVLKRILRKVRERKYAEEELDDLLIHYSLYDQSHWNSQCGKHPECRRQGCARTCFWAHEAMLIHKLVRCGDTTPSVVRKHEELEKGEERYWKRHWKNLRSRRENVTLDRVDEL